MFKNFEEPNIENKNFEKHTIIIDEIIFQNYEKYIFTI